MPALQATGVIPLTPVPLAAHIGAPIVLHGGHLYGTICCFGFGESRSMGEVALFQIQKTAEIVGRLYDQAASSPHRRFAEQAARAPNW